MNIKPLINVKNIMGNQHLFRNECTIFIKRTVYEIKRTPEYRVEEFVAVLIFPTHLCIWLLLWQDSLKYWSTRITSKKNFTYYQTHL